MHYSVMNNTFNSYIGYITRAQCRLPQKAKTQSNHIGISTKICLRSAQIWPKEKLREAPCWLWQVVGAPLRPIKIKCSIESSSNRPYLCSHFPLLFCHMFMMLFSLGFHESHFFCQGKQLILFFVHSHISCHNVTFLFRRERLSVFFLFSSIYC